MTATTTRLAPAIGYTSLAAVLDEALAQAQSGKGRDRHASAAERFEDQQIVQLGEWMNRSTAFCVGQACKKAIESTRLGDEAAVHDLLGAINYLAAAVLVIRRRPAKCEVPFGTVELPAAKTVRRHGKRSTP